MTETAMFVGWGKTYPGREKFALKFFAEFIEILKGLEAEGEIERFETFLLTPNTSEFDGFTLIYGEPEKLAAIQMREDLHKLQVQTRLANASFSIIWALTGEAVEREYSLFGELVAEFEHVPELV